MKNETQSALVARDAAIILLLIWAFMQALLMIWAPADTQTTYLLLLFLMSVRLLSLVEGRVVEVLLGERMPRRPLYTERDKPWTTRLKELFTGGRTWTAPAWPRRMPRRPGAPHG